MDEETLPEVAFLVETLEDKVRDKSREAPVRGTRGRRWGRAFPVRPVSPSDLNACRKAAGRCGDAGRQAPGAGGTRHPWRVRQLRFICAHGRVLHGHGKGRRPVGTVRVTPGQRWLCQAPGGLGGGGVGMATLGDSASGTTSEESARCRQSSSGKMLVTLVLRGGTCGRRRVG